MRFTNSASYLSTILVSLALGCGDDGTEASTGQDTDPTSGTTGSGSASVTASTTAGTGASTTDATTAGSASTTDDPTGGGSDPASACVETCEQDGDCLDGFVCGAEGYCEPRACPDDDWCAATLGGWTNEGCTADAQCDAGQCVVLGDHTFCTVPSNAGCFEATPTEVMTVDGATVTVCVSPGRCGDDSTCFRGCASDDDCIVAGFPSCDTDTGQCECTTDSCGTGSTCDAGTCRCESDEGCSPIKGGSVCVDGTCACASDDDCLAPGLDTCIDGVCSCGSDEACSAVDIHPGGDPVCAPV